MAAPVTAPPDRTGLPRRVANGCVVVFSCKGGAGATMLSLNAAYRTARDAHSACIVDLDLQMGDALAAMGMSPRYNIAQATLSLQQGESFGKNLLPQHASGVAVLSQVGALDDIDRITPDSMAALVQTVRQNYDVVLVDGVRDFGDNALAVLDVADKITMVTVQEVLAIRRARWAFGILRKIGFDPQDITVVVNRYNPQGDITLESVRAMFEPALVLTVPEDSRMVLQSLNRGVPLLESRKLGPVGEAVTGVWANAVYDEVPEYSGEPDSEEGGRPPVWRRLFGRRRQNP